MNIMLRDFNEKLTSEDIFKLTRNDRLHANINGNSGGEENLSTMFPNENTDKNICTTPDEKTHKQCESHRSSA
jgi:endonuclease IV